MGTSRAVVEDRESVVLTQRQLEVLQWVANGKRDAETAKLLGVSDEAVRATVWRAMELTGSATRSAVVAYAIRRQLIR